MLFPGFNTFDIDCNGTTIHGVSGGHGPALLLLHGYPQTHSMWHKVAPALSQLFTLVIPDLRGYGRSGKPVTTIDHAPYSKRAMAADMAALMQHFNHQTFAVCAHDRGARVAHRLALDWPEQVERMMLLDIAPTREMYAHTTDSFARAYWHWFFLIQKAPFPETLISAHPDKFWLSKCGIGAAGLTPFTEAALQDYLSCFRDPDVIHGSCEDYRAAATIDLQHDDEDDGRMVECPLEIIWAKDGVIERCFDALALWRIRAVNVEGYAMPGGHYLAEEQPQLLTQAIRKFFQ